MGLFSKHKGRKAHSFVFSIQVHTLTSPSSRGSLVVACERGKHHAATAPAAPASLRSGAAGAVYLFEETLQLPATLYEVRGICRTGARFRLLLTARPSKHGTCPSQPLLSPQPPPAGCGGTQERWAGRL